MNISMRDRYRGAMVGTLCGDALGAPYEWKKADFIQGDIHLMGGMVPGCYQPFDYIDPWDKNHKRQMKMGQPTDDSELAAALASSLIEYPNFNPENLYNWLRGFIHGRKSILTDIAFGTGSTLKAALLPATYAESLEKFARGEMPIKPSNGSLMRCIAIPLRYHYENSHPLLIKSAERQSEITHVHPLAKACCAAYSVLVSMILNGFNPAEAWLATKWSLYNLHHDSPDISTVRLIEPTEPTEEDIWPQCGSVVLSFRVALWATLNAASFPDGILKAISVGGDTDTYAAIAGGILGAHYGIQGIPEHWQEILQGRQIMLSLADRLCELAQK